jgi:HEAT repeat protein
VLLAVGFFWWRSPSRRVRRIIDDQYVSPMSHDILSWRRSPDSIYRDLDSLGEAAVLPLIELLHSTDPRVRQLAAWDLGRLHDQRAVDPLLAMLKQPTSEETLPREAAAMALGNIGGKRAAAGLLEHLNDPDDRVRGAVIDALRKLPTTGLVSTAPGTRTTPGR